MGGGKLIERGEEGASAAREEPRTRPEGWDLEEVSGEGPTSSLLSSAGEVEEEREGWPGVEEREEE